MKTKILENGICIVTLNTPEKGNSFGSAEAEIIESLLRKKLKGLVLCSSSRRLFCTGGNLAEQASKTRAQSLKVQKRIRAALDKLSSAPFPTVAAVRGDAFGGGVEVLSAFDRVFATPESVFALWQRKIGVVFGWGGGERLRARLGEQSLRLLSLESRLIGAREAADLGLIDEVIPEARMMSAAMEWLEKQVSLPEISFEPLKKWSPQKGARSFDKLWMNKIHRAAVESYKK